MIVILTQDVKSLGKAGDVVKVRNGHARNLLIPKGLAAAATDGNIRDLDKQKKLVAEKQQQSLKAAKELAGRINGLNVKIVTKSGENGRLFGSITSKDIADALKEQHRIEVDKRKLVLESPIKTIGEFPVEIKVFAEVNATLQVVVEG
ncbi:MAG: 50S ribosomal protein L9 [Clostridiales Family XIII bacterium]|jgi:large subunit ribosomal protein L9|nr:50S ribosomal protein L9 [Clostridiales Family XIII bacterium]